MAGVSVRHTIVTDQDVEKLSSHWKFLRNSSFVLTDVKGFHEARFKQAIPDGTAEFLQHIMSLRLVYRTQETLGSLLYSDAFLGLTVELVPNNIIHPSLLTSISSYLKVFTGSVDTATLSQAHPFITLTDRLMFYNASCSEHTLQNAITRLVPEATKFIESATFLELTLEKESELLTLRTIQAVPRSLIIDIITGGGSTEVGLLQRQRRELADSEYKGLSAFLPARDLGMTPLYIYKVRQS